MVSEHGGSAEDGPAASPGHVRAAAGRVPSAWLGGGQPAAYPHPTVSSPLGAHQGSGRPPPFGSKLRSVSALAERFGRCSCPAQGPAGCAPPRAAPHRPPLVSRLVSLQKKHVSPCRADGQGCPETVSVLSDPKSQCITPNLGSWFLLHLGGVSVEPPCLLCGKGLNLSQELQPLVTGSSLAATSAPSNHKHQVPWPNFSFHIC